MTELLEHAGIEAVTTAADSILPQPPSSLAITREAKTGRAPSIGFHRLDTSCGFLAIGAAFGRLAADQIDHLAEAANNAQAELRVTPWRSVLIAPIDERRSAELLSLAGLGLITDADDPRLAVAACPGAPACANASVTTREDADLLAPLARERPASQGIGLHISGCLKGCAKSEAAPVTLVGREGRYDIVFDGRAGDTPSHSGLTIEDVRALLLRRGLRQDAAAAIGNAG
jgi:precorrin-3B synthase